MSNFLKRTKRASEEIDYDKIHGINMPPDNGDICWNIGSETFTRKEVADMLHTQRAMISNDLKSYCGNGLTKEMYAVLDNPRTPKF